MVKKLTNPCEYTEIFCTFATLTREGVGAGLRRVKPDGFGFVRHREMVQGVLPRGANLNNGANEGAGLRHVKRRKDYDYGKDER